MQGSRDTSASTLEQPRVTCPSTSCDYRSSLLLTYHKSKEYDTTKRSRREGRHAVEREIYSDHRIDTYLSPHSFEAVWQTIWNIISKVQDLCFENGSRAYFTPGCQTNFFQTLRIVELAWTRWCNRRHAAAVHEAALHTQLSSFVATLRVLQIACELGPTRLIIQQLDHTHREALSLHVYLKDTRRLPLSLGDVTISPPVPLRTRERKVFQLSPGRDRMVDRGL